MLHESSTPPRQRGLPGDQVGPSHSNVSPEFVGRVGTDAAGQQGGQSRGVIGALADDRRST
jgi:hypothetical protein